VKRKVHECDNPVCACHEIVAQARELEATTDEAARMLPTMYRVRLIVQYEHEQTMLMLQGATMDADVDGVRKGAHELLALMLAKLIDPPA